MLARDVAVHRTNTERRCQREVRDAVVGRHPLHDVRHHLRVFDAFADERMEHRAAGIARLQRRLHVQRLEEVVGIADRQLRRVGVIGIGVARADDVRELLAVEPRQTEAGAFRRGRFEVVDVPRGFLEVRDLLFHMVEHLDGELLADRVADRAAEEVQTRFVHAHQTDRAEMEFQRPEVGLGVGQEIALEVLVHDLALDLERFHRQLHQVVEAAEEFVFGLGEVADARHIDRDHADRTGLFARAEEPAGFVAEFAHIHLEAAAHAPDVAGIEVAVDEVLEIGQTVFAGGREEQFGVFRIPVEILGDVVGRDREGENAPVAVAVGHDFEESLVDHVHFLLVIAVAGAVHQFAADDDRRILEVFRHHPVEGEVGEGRLAPAARDVEPEDEALEVLFLFLY